MIYPKIAACCHSSSPFLQLLSVLRLQGSLNQAFLRNAGQILDRRLARRCRICREHVSQSLLVARLSAVERRGGHGHIVGLVLASVRGRQQVLVVGGLRESERLCGKVLAGVVQEEHLTVGRGGVTCDQVESVVLGELGRLPLLAESGGQRAGLFALQVWRATPQIVQSFVLR